MVKKIILDDPDCERYISKWELIKDDINFIKNIFSFFNNERKKAKSIILSSLLLNILFLLIVDFMVMRNFSTKFGLLIMK